MTLVGTGIDMPEYLITYAKDIFEYITPFGYLATAILVAGFIHLIQKWV
jgi:hypothetical protein